MTNEYDIIKKYQRLIYKIVRGVAKNHSYLEFDDYISEANIAAMKAIRSYNESKKAKISSYIATCVLNRLKDIAKNNIPKTFIPIDTLIDDEHPTVTTFTAILTEEEKDALKHVSQYGKCSLVKLWRKDKQYTKQQAIEAVNLCFCRIHRKLS